MYRSQILQVNSKYSLESSRRDLYNALLCTVLIPTSNIKCFVTFHFLNVYFRIYLHPDGSNERCKGVYCVDLGESFHMSIYYLLAKFGFDTAKNEPTKVCPLSVYRSPRFVSVREGGDKGEVSRSFSQLLCHNLQHAWSNLDGIVRPMRERSAFEECSELITRVIINEDFQDDGKRSCVVVLSYAHWHGFFMPGTSLSFKTGGPFSNRFRPPPTHLKI